MDLEKKTCEPTAEKYQAERASHWNSVAQKMRHWKGWGGYYHRRLNEIYACMIPQGARVLEIGCGNGDLLASLKPRVGAGVDFSPEMVALAKELHPELQFINGSADQFDVEGSFDFIILSDILNDMWDVQAVFEHIRQFASPDVRVVINSYSRLWELPLTIAVKLGLSKPGLGQNWLTVSDMRGLLTLSGFEPIRASREILFPIGIPLLAPLLNRFLVRFWPFNHFALTNFIVARLQPAHKLSHKPPLVSVIVPARNEEGNIENIFNRMPEMGAGTEIVFVEGHSTDNTFSAIQQGMKRRPKQRCISLQQTGKGKGDAVRLGFTQATGDVLMILDADLTVPPEDLPRFYEGLVSGNGDFINGVRLVYPMEDEAMRFFNLIGNKFFSLAFSWLLGQPIKDTLCGTKVLWKKDYERIAANRHVFGNFDPFGDFDLLFGAARLNFKIIDLPIRYRARTYGTTNIQRWKHGWLLLRMVLFAAKRIKFI
ncbi:MAG: glycosyl transferase family protein [Chloroflexi bacterium]|nr:MAG: glycosyl transferase family protein [Chloroflexota bacterium]